MLGLRRRILFARSGLASDDGALVRSKGAIRLARCVRGGEVEAWLLPGDGVTAARPGPLAVFAHGNGELIDHWPAALAPYRTLGVTVLLPEFRGYGRSAGRPNERALVDDFAWFLRGACARPEVDEARVIFHGRSLGGGVVCQLARVHPPQALVLWSTFTSLDTVARRFGVPRWFVPDHFRSDAVLQQLRVPTFLAHGTDDLLIPASHARELAAMVPHSELHLYPAGHNDCPPAGARHWEDLADFLRRANIVDRGVLDAL